MLALLAAVFRGGLTDRTVEAYEIGLEGLTPAQIERATKLLLQRHKEFLPSPAQVRQAAEDSAPPVMFQEALPEPEMTAEEKAAGLRELREVIAKLRGIAAMPRQP